MTRARDVANLIGSGNYSSTTFTATAGQTAFTISHTQGFIQVFMNGLLLDETVDYTSNGSAVTLTSGAAAGDEIEVVAYNTFSVGDALNQAAADARYELDGAENRFLGVDGTTVTTSSNEFAKVQQGTGSSNYAEMHIGNDINQRVVLGSIGSNYTASTDWAGSRYLYSTHGDLLIKSAAELELFSGGNTVANHRSIVCNINGHVTMPRVPAFNAVALANNYQNNSWQKVIYNQSVQQTGGTNYSSTDSRFTAPVAGWYQFNCSWTAANNADVDGTIGFHKNNVRSGANGTVSQPNTGGSYDGHSVSSTIYLSANDYIEVWRYSTVTTQTRGYSWTGNFSGFLVG